jgi:hypothetical protein
MAEDQPTVLHEQGLRLCEHTPQPQPPASALRPHTP